jgi:predicted RNase H-like HicB family nuclease
MSTDKSQTAPGVELLKEEDMDVWQEHHGNVFRLPVHLYPEEEVGGYSVIAPSLPGVVSQGETEPESLANITEALAAAISAYKAASRPIPWTDPAPEPDEGAIVRWVFVNV